MGPSRFTQQYYVNDRTDSCTTQTKNNSKEVLNILKKKFSRSGNRKTLADEAVGDVVKRFLNVNTFLDFIHTTKHPAIIALLSQSRGSVNHFTHSELHTFIEKSFNLAKFNLFRGDRVAICLPEGPALSVCLLSTMAYCTCVPSNYKLTSEELLADYKQLKVRAVVVPYSRLSIGNDALIDGIRRAGMQLIGLKTSYDSRFTFSLVEDPKNRIRNSTSNASQISTTPSLNEANDIVMLIQTSGTSGQKKVVPYRLQTLCISTICVIFSLDVRSTDTLINMMPLFHIGGIIRNLLTPIFSGGSVIQCQGFDPVLFCDILAKQTSPVWFYGVASMQQSIIQEVAMRKLPSKYCDLVKKVCNAGGSLPPLLAKDIKATFRRATVLPSYGMTECMPICAPPIDYGLQLEGTSGRVAGPELAIAIDGNITFQDNIVGHILVRGGPCFEGYEDVDNSLTFDADGFFDTGDMGYMKDGFIYITCRSKEVINRGGEILSPLEIENVIVTHPRVAQVMAFSVPHQTLQEAVGCVIVPHDPNTRPDIPSLRTFLEKKLHPSKHPELLVYMNDIPRNSVGKITRIDFSSRLSLPCISHEALPSELLFEANCVKKGTTVTVTTCCAVKWSVNDVTSIVENHPQIKACAGYRNYGKFFLFVVGVNGGINDLAATIGKYLKSMVHDYMQPTKIVIVPHDVFKDWKAIDENDLVDLVQQQQKSVSDPVTLVLCDLFGLTLGISQFPADGNFFDYGGNSLKTGFLSSLIRRKLGVTFPASTIYEEDNQTPIGLAVKCRPRIPKDHRLLTQGYNKFLALNGKDQNRTFGSSDYKKDMKMRPKSGAKNPFSPFIMLFQASPFVLMQPVISLLRWIIFVHVLLYQKLTLKTAINVQLPNLLWLLLSLLTTECIVIILFPLIGIIMKWLIIGRYRTGTFPLWGSYYLRWWFINKLLLVTHLGVFKFTPGLYTLYLRLMGAKLGKGSRVSYLANVQEFDLITIGANCYIDDCTLRPFVLTTGHMNLSSIVIGDNCVIGFRSNIVAGTNLANGTVIGPQTSTYTRDMQCSGSAAHRDTAEGKSLLRLCKETFPEPHSFVRYAIGWPLILLTKIVSLIPWFYCLYLLMKHRSFRKKCANVSEIIVYFSRPERIGWFILARCVRCYVVQLLYMILVILIKRFVVGEFKAGPRKVDQISLLKYFIMKNLLTAERWKLLVAIIGSHYEIVSVIYRLLGAKVGKRVYWPGSNFNVITFDLLTVGNDVIFGSRSEILCADAEEFATVTIEDGAMCADNCVILPGGRIGRSAMLGSGGLIKKHFTLTDGSIWYGSFNGNAVKLSDGNISKKLPAPVEVNDEISCASTATIVPMEKYDKETCTPFGLAFYERKANYFVFPITFIILYNAVLLFIDTILLSLPIICALQVTALYIKEEHHHTNAKLVLILFSCLSIFRIAVAAFSFLLEIAAKWIFLGKVTEGTYAWDKSSYCQRWQMVKAFQYITRPKMLDLIGGSAWILLHFRALGSKIGKRVCLYPGGVHTPITEPDLVVLEDDVAVDRASLICHLNSYGEFSVHPLCVRAGSVLQNDSRLAPGATMLEDCTLLDHSYIVQGETAEANSVWQGYPAISTSLVDQYSWHAQKKLV